MWVRELNDAALNLIALIHQEYVASGKLGSPNDHGVGGGADDSHIGLSLQAYFTICEVQITGGLDGDIQLNLVSHALAGR